MKRTVLVCGFPGSGKTTLIRRLADHWGRANCEGFFTGEKREGRRRTGFTWESFQGLKGNLADLQAGLPRVGKYRVDLPSFERLLSRLESVDPTKILIIDEVGKMECLSPKFRTLLPIWEQSKSLMIFTVPARGTPFIEAFKERHAGELVRIGMDNRDDLFRRLCGLQGSGADP